MQCVRVCRLSILSDAACRALGLTLGACLALTALTGCGTTKNISATEQLIASDAVDAAIAKIDFSPLAGQSIFFDDRYISDYKGIGFVNSNYIISSLRQQIIAAGCLLQDKVTDAEFVIEGRVGTLGSDAFDMIYGIPQNNGLSSAATLVSGGPSLPTIPEISVARRNEMQGAAKVALFAYHRESRERVWQSGLATARSNSKDSWILGAGPFQQGTIYGENVRFGGKKYHMPFLAEQPTDRGGGFASLKSSALFSEGTERLSKAEPVVEEESATSKTGIQQVSGKEQQKKEPQKLPASAQAEPLSPHPATPEGQPQAAAPTPPVTSPPTLNTAAPTSVK